MSITFFGPDAVKAETMQDLYRQLTINKEGNFEVEFPAAGTPESAQAYETTRVTLLTLFRNGLTALKAQDGNSIMRLYYPTPGIPTAFFDEKDMEAALNTANMILNPNDPYFALMVADGEIGAIRVLGDTINMVNKYADARTAFVLLRMFARSHKEGEQEKMLAELPFDQRKDVLVRRRNSMLAVSFRADNNYLIPELFKKFSDQADQQTLTGLVNAFDQNALRLKLTELQQSRWLFVLLNSLNSWQGAMTDPLREGLNSLVLAFNSAQKDEEVALKIDGFVDAVIRPTLPADQQGEAPQQDSSSAAPQEAPASGEVQPPHSEAPAGITLPHEEAGPAA
ncbi:hypothetical protein CO046_04975 [Candidatus Peregrinibacteria bacterium CG_4_9_14_0_2_um_filter_53_11]|nr:MAG: hypothetical protein CO046_04975 [Candidatus Peregrinibacteria bacterium CG_4_9_14_0_2_um_filter_53_11]